MSKVIVYGDVSLDVIDGSSVWLSSICEVLTSVFEEVHLQLKLDPRSEALLGHLRDVPNLIIHPRNVGEPNVPLTHREAAHVLERLALEIGADAVIARGFELCYQLSRNHYVAPILWSYITDLPYPVTKLSTANVSRLRSISERSRRMFAQTEAARSYLESISPEAAGKTVLLPPMVPDSEFIEDSGTHAARDSSGQLKIIYSGKLAKEWRTLEMLELPEHLRDLGIDATLTVVGSKFMSSSSDPLWLERMKHARDEVRVGKKYNVQWLEGVNRAAAMREVAKADLGLSWRTSSLDASLEISTKAIEYSALGIPSIINRTADHVEIFGDDYPFYVSGQNSVRQVASVIAENLVYLDEYSRRVASRAKFYSFSSARERFKRVFTREGSLERRTHPGAEQRKRRIAVVSHDFKFLGELMDALKRDPLAEIRVDGWESLHKHSASHSRSILDWADTILCEWAGPAVKWYANNKRSGTRLIVRLHAFELRGAWIKNINWQAVDKVIFVSELYRRKAIELLGLDFSKTTVIPNALDVDDFNRPKTQGAEFNLALVGMVGFSKRPDRAVECLEYLLDADARYRLYIKGRPPWEYPYEWDRPVQRQLYLEFFKRIRESKRLRSAVVFDGFSPDIASWFRKIGWVLSPSTHESFHMAPAEGMASGAVPIFWDREGVKEIFPGIDAISDSQDAATQISEINTSRSWPQAGSIYKEYAQRWDSPRILVRWREVLAI